MNRLERVREQVDGSLHRVEDLAERRCGLVHLYGVSAVAAFLAARRGLNAEWAAMAGMLDDPVSYEIRVAGEHGSRVALRAIGLLRGLGAFSESEIQIICSAIERPSEKGTVNGPLDELLKDADVLQHSLYDPNLASVAGHEARREALCEELDLDTTRSGLTPGIWRTD